ncbi:amidase [Astrocystis sublimbata]|nr:amidase [Astrocystis sublimbata]
MDEEVKLRVGDIDYVLIEHDTSIPVNMDTLAPHLFLVYTEVHFEPSAEVELASWNVSNWSFATPMDSLEFVPGPYVFAKGKFWQPWRVYHDIQGTFILDVPEAGLDGRVIVPSRCYFTPSPSRPLDGVRIGVKDNIEIEGHKTTLNNRSWRQLYPPAARHADCVQRLIDAGAIIVGKLKLQAMIMREEPVEAVEFTSPFNPRGDGYQVLSGSSNGSAAAIGSYDWLDFTLGSDTNGSVRKPAHYNGCFSVRPSMDIMNTDGVLGQFPLFDMPGFYTRDVSKIPDVMSVWYGDSPMLRKPFQNYQILYPRDYLPTVNASQTAIFDAFVTGLETALQVKRTEISLAQCWKDDLPDGSGHPDIDKYLLTAGAHPFFRDAYEALEPFRQDYQAKYGKPPFIHRGLLWQWEVAKTITQEDRDECWRRVQVYRQWLLDNIFKAESEDTLSIMVFPIEEAKPNYRDAPEPPFGLLPGFSSLHVSPMMRSPEITAIVGEMTFESIVTKRTEPYPVAASVTGPPGTDFIIADLVEKGMKAAGIATKVKTGASVY